MSLFLRNVREARGRNWGSLILFFSLEGITRLWEREYKRQQMFMRDLDHVHKAHIKKILMIPQHSIHHLTNEAVVKNGQKLE